MYSSGIRVRPRFLKRLTFWIACELLSLIAAFCCFSLLIRFCFRLVKFLTNFAPAGVILPLITLTSWPILKRPLSMIYPRSVTRFLTMLIRNGSTFHSFFCSHDSTSNGLCLANSFRLRRLLIFLCAERLPRDFMRSFRLALSKVYDFT